MYGKRQIMTYMYTTFMHAKHKLHDLHIPSLLSSVIQSYKINLVHSRRRRSLASWLVWRYLPGRSRSTMRCHQYWRCKVRARTPPSPCHWLLSCPKYVNVVMWLLCDSCDYMLGEGKYNCTQRPICWVFSNTVTYYCYKSHCTCML